MKRQRLGGLVLWVSACVLVARVEGSGHDGKTLLPSRPDSRTERAWSPPVDGSVAGDEVLRNFSEVAKIPRPSKGEAAIREFLLSRARDLNGKIWNGRLRLCADPYGNAEIQLPATGKYAGRHLPAIALQSHMDMVWTVKGAPPQSDLTPYFAHGVKLVETDGWLHSPDDSSTIGADDGIGIAMEMRYLQNAKLEHPPLHLMFTVREELGTDGAHNFTCPMKAPVLLNLDSEDGEKFVYGSQGIHMDNIVGTVPARPLPSGQAFIHIGLMNLKGGHSGENIHLNRANAILVEAALMKKLLERRPAPWLVSAVGGNAMNAIPTSSQMVISVPPDQAASVIAEAKKYLRDELGKYSDERTPGVPWRTDEHFSIEEVSAPGSLGLSPRITGKLMSALLSAKNGAIDKAKGFPHDVETSSNLGLFSVKLGLGGDQVSINYMARTFDPAQLAKVVADNRAILEAPFRGYARISQQQWLPPWLTGPKSWLFKLMQQRFPKFEMELAPGGLETSEFTQKRPDVQMISMGPLMEFGHSSDERVNIKSVVDTTKVLDEMLESVAQAPQFQGTAKAN